MIKFKKKLGQVKADDKIWQWRDKAKNKAILATDLGQWVLAHSNIEEREVKLKVWVEEVNHQCYYAKGWRKRMRWWGKVGQGWCQRKWRGSEGWVAGDKDQQQRNDQPRIRTRRGWVVKEKDKWKNISSRGWGRGQGQVPVDKQLRMRPRPELCRRPTRATISRSRSISRWFPNS